MEGETQTAFDAGGDRNMPASDLPNAIASTIKRKAEDEENNHSTGQNPDSKRRRGTAPIKEQYLVHDHKDSVLGGAEHQHDHVNDDAAEAFHHNDRRPNGENPKKKGKDRSKGQNKARSFGSSKDKVGLCASRMHSPELSPNVCQFGDKCRFEHDLRRYLREHKREDLQTFDSLCPVWQVKGRCPVGWKCRFVGSHSKTVETSDGRSELVLVDDPARMAEHDASSYPEEGETGVANIISPQDRITLAKKNFPTPKSDQFLAWLEQAAENPSDQGRRFKPKPEVSSQEQARTRNSSSPEIEVEGKSGEAVHDRRSTYKEAPLRPSEKRRLYFGPETPILAPLTTQGNLPFRRLCTSLGATFTYSEMAMSMPILQGQKSEWALIKAHESEVQPPTFTFKDGSHNIVYDYDQSQDLRFGAQIAANKPWLVCKATEILTTLIPKGLRCVDLNVGCPIDLVYREGSGSALMDSPHKLEKMLRGMNTVSGETPVTVKIRMGTKDKVPTAQKLVDRLVLGNENHRGDSCGVAAITLHGRSRQQRYTRSADWSYIAETAALIKSLNTKADQFTDTIHEVDERDQPNGHGTQHKRAKVFFIGNGDVYSHQHYDDHVRYAHVDGVMVARGALIKPWLFEEISAGQYLDKSSSERLGYIEKFCRYGLEAWGSDEIGVGQTRRFLLEWLSFACRYVPVGLLEYLPPSIQDRPPKYKGRDELETLMASDNFRDWIKISEMFLGPAHENFQFVPKHKSNSYEIEAEG